MRDTVAGRDLTHDADSEQRLGAKELGLYTTPQHHITVRHLTLKLFLSMDDLTLKITHKQSDANSPFRD